MDDTISRQAAIDTLADMYCKSDEDGYVWIIRSDAWARIDALPSAQPEIIHCRNCKYQDQGSNESESWNLCKYRPWAYVPIDDDHYCGYAERRTDE